MLLGHWYLIDPKLPRSALRTLAYAGILGLLAEAGLQLSLSTGMGGGGWGFWILLATSVVLMVAVIAALRYPAYSGVMAATGLSYLALLTTLGAVFVGRAMAAGLGPFNV
jgi:Kef-type K+ transport system membrane component KefB